MDILNPFTAISVADKIQKRLSPSHSLSDWYYTPGIGWTLSSLYYVSPPSAVTLFDPTTSRRARIYLGSSLGQCIPEGRLTTAHYYYLNSQNEIYLNFRSQEYTDVAVANNTYYCRLYLNTFWIGKIVAGVTTVLATFPLTYARTPQVWQGYRITWWLDYSDPEAPSLQIMLEQEYEGSFVEVITVPDSNPNWSDSENNFVGLYILGTKYITSSARLDNTIVERKT